MGQFTDLLSDEVFDLHEEGVDDMIESDIAELIELHYPPKWVNCSSCTQDQIGQKPFSVNIDGRQIPIPSAGSCSVCGGTQKTQQEVTEQIRGLVYWDVKSWINVGRDVQLADGLVQVQTYFSYLPKVLQAREMVVGKRTQPSKTYTYQLIGEPIPTGFRGKYILFKLQRKQ